jgi:nucleoside-diphosphate-sugar epimerase
VWIRPSLVFGNNVNEKRFIGSLLYALKFNKRVKVFINGQIRDFLYVNDLCKFINLLINTKANIKSNVLNVTAENFINFNFIFSYFPKKIQNKLKKLIINNPNKKNIDYYSSGRKLKGIFKKFKFTNFKKALSLTFKSFL